MRITNGSVTYSQVVKDADYGVNRKGEYMLSFSLSEEEQDADYEELLALAGQIALKQCAHILGKPLEKVGRNTVPEFRPQPVVHPVDVPAAAPPGDDDKPVKRGPGRPPKVRLTPPVQAEKQLDIEDAIIAHDSFMSDAELQETLKQLATVKGGQAVRQFMAEQTWYKVNSRDCPQADRHAFIDAVEKLPNKQV
jgi:hypothetical protein